MSPSRSAPRNWSTGSRRSCALLHLLASCPGQVFSRGELLERVWGYSFAGNTRTVDVHVNRLRQKLAAHGLPEDLITTEWGVGYKLEPPAGLDARELGGG